ncbi:MAG: hypothetical protein QW806_02540 [Nitrososphaerota archaeon]
MVEKVPGWIERILLTKLSEITGEIKAINARIDSLEKRIQMMEKLTEFGN